MSQNLFIDVLEANRFCDRPMRLPVLNKPWKNLAQNSDPAVLHSLHLTLGDAGEQSESEVMLSLVHFLESFDVQEQVQAFVQVLPELVKRAKEWTAILHSRIMNDAIAKAEFEKRVRLIYTQERGKINGLPKYLVNSNLLSA